MPLRALKSDLDPPAWEMDSKSRPHSAVVLSLTNLQDEEKDSCQSAYQEIEAPHAINNDNTEANPISFRGSILSHGKCATKQFSLSLYT